MFLIIANPYGKCVEVKMTNPTTLATIAILDEQFVTYDVLMAAVSNNGT